MQRGYAYQLTQPPGRNFDAGFEPELTPKEMLELGVFGGKYMNDCRDEFPASWFRKAKLSPEGRDPKLNFFGVNASQSLKEWRRKGWIYPDDPRGHSCLLLGFSGQGRAIHVLCSPKMDYLAIITAYLPDPLRWSDDFRSRC